MSQYKELADRLSTFINDEAFLDAVDEAAAILRSLDAQPVAWCALMPNGKIAYFDGRPMVMPGPVGNEHHTTPLYAAPVAAPQSLDAQPVAPIDMVLFCPACGTQHIDAPDTPDPYPTPEKDAAHWTNPPHRSHLCHNPDCNHIWRPADVPTNGVQAVKTVGKADSPIAAPVAAQPTKHYRTLRGNWTNTTTHVCNFCGFETRSEHSIVAHQCDGRKAAQPQQAPDTYTVDAVAWETFVREYDRYSQGDPKYPFSLIREGMAAVIHSAKPQQAKLEPLSEEWRARIVRANKKYHDSDEIDPYGVIDDVEAAHGIKG